MQVDTIDFPVAVAQNLYHGNGLCILLNDDLRQQIQYQNEHQRAEYQEQTHHAAHRANQLTRCLCQIIHSDFRGNRCIINVCDLLIREVRIEVGIIFVKRLIIKAAIHEHGNGGWIIIDTADLELVLVAAVRVFQGNGIALFYAVLFRICAGNFHLIVRNIQFHIFAVRLYAIQGNTLTAAFLA